MTFRLAKCTGNTTTNKCTNIGTIPVSKFDRGGRNAYLCPECARRLYGYHDENKQMRGKEKKNNFTFSFELETHGNANGSLGADLKGRMELAGLGFLPTSDCTVDIEFKSPIYDGLNAPIKATTSINRLLVLNHISIDDECGTHFHVGHKTKINSVTMNYIRRFCNSLFVPLSDAIENDSVKAENFFGRGFNSWAYPIRESSHAMTHENFINMQHENTLEFRIAYFRNDEQYKQVMRFAKDVTACIITNFIDNFNKCDSTDSQKVTEYRKHKAQVTAKKLVKIYEKYTR